MDIFYIIIDFIINFFEFFAVTDIFFGFVMIFTIAFAVRMLVYLLIRKDIYR